MQKGAGNAVQRVLLDPMIDQVLTTTAQMLGLTKATVTTIVLVGLPMMAWMAETDAELLARLFAASQVTLPEPIHGLYARMASNPAIRRAAVEDYMASFGASLDAVHREAAKHAGTTERQARNVLAASLPAVTQVLGQASAGRGEQGFAAGLRALGAAYPYAPAKRETPVGASGP